MPMIAEPLPGRTTSAASERRSCVGTCPSPSYQWTFTVGPAVRFVPGNSQLTSDLSAHTSRFTPGDEARTVRGAVSSRAMKTGSRMWQPKSPSWPLEKSCQARQLKGW